MRKIRFIECIAIALIIGLHVPAYLLLFDKTVFGLDKTSTVHIIVCGIVVYAIMTYYLYRKYKKMGL